MIYDSRNYKGIIDFLNSSPSPVFISTIVEIIKGL